MKRVLLRKDSKLEQIEKSLKAKNKNFIKQNISTLNAIAYESKHWKSTGDEDQVESDEEVQHKAIVLIHKICNVWPDLKSYFYA